MIHRSLMLSVDEDFLALAAAEPPILSHPSQREPEVKQVWNIPEDEVDFDPEDWMVVCPQVEVVSQPEESVPHVVPIHGETEEMCSMQDAQPSLLETQPPPLVRPLCLGHNEIPPDRFGE